MSVAKRKYVSPKPPRERHQPAYDWAIRGWL